MKARAYAKINLSLNVFNKTDGYHGIDSVVVSIDVCNVASATKRRDGKISVKPKYFGDYASVDNTLKAAEMFKKKYNVGGFDVTLARNIPVGGGMGGSSADVAATLNALSALYKAGDVKDIADAVGSDCGYMLTGGAARLTGRGDIVEPFKCKPFYMVIIVAEEGVSTAKAYDAFDKLAENGELSDNAALIYALSSGDLVGAAEQVNNALIRPAETLSEEVRLNLAAMRDLCPLCASMSGSGSTVFGIFETEELCRWAADKLKKSGKKAFVVKTIDP